VTCEHASNAVPARWRKSFAADRTVLDTHRAWDPGAVILARELAAKFNASLHEGKFTRLLIDLNRREQSKAAFSAFTPEPAKPELLAFHHAWRESVAADAATQKGRLLHVSCHSFTPELRGQVRNAEIGLLYDPRRKLERATADAWHKSLTTVLPGMRIRRNYPYKGVSDGITTWLRRKLPPTRYAGFEIELNQSFAARPPEQWTTVRQAIIEIVRLLQ
jgi:predicted N-formylglutamate amidohydrolase